MASAGPNYRWWIPAEGIHRQVIQADIQRYLGPEACMRPGTNNDGTPGYWISALRTFTPTMIEDLKADSANFANIERSGARVRYEESQVHTSRQYYGPSGGDAAYQYPEPVAPAATTSHYQQSAQGATAYPQDYYSRQGGGYPTTQARAPQVYTHAPGAPPPSGYPGGYYDPRQAQAATPRYQGNNGYQTAVPPPAPPSAPTAQQAAPAPAGYYLANDGRYYPNN
ncbi:hypothetical protein EJ06DRAFT_118365 [Trichodelitschia bisporula]|uniref:Uncharacterized protein n=1 Tax=Trichodelitschia bisporula TaxID=703511 RepID=A0A6G1HPK2_9PEZI|nr:hypothetical protein EJ06DRAFT_118365 [Trichodelitschia bisporula]